MNDVRMKVNPHESVFAFIDSQNLNLGAQTQGWKIDFARLRVYLRDKYHVAKALIFIGYIPTNQRLYTYLQNAGYVVIFKPVLEVKTDKKVVVKGNIDAELVLHAMIEFENYDKAIIVSGDGDFFCLVEYLQQKEKLKKIMVPNNHYSSLLKKYSGYIVNVSLVKSKLEHKKKVGIPSGRTLW